MIGLTATSKRTYMKEDLPDCCCQWPHPCGEPLLTHSSTGELPTIASIFGSVSYGVTVPSPWILVHARFCALQEWSLFPPVLYKSNNQMLLIFKVGFPWLGSLMWSLEPSQQWRTTLVLLLPSLWVTHPVNMWFYLIMIVPLTSCCGFFVFGCRVSFFWWVVASFHWWLCNS